jgi:CHAT domain-containing protein
VARLTSRLEARQDARAVAKELAAELIQPAHSLLARGFRKLVIIPDGSLNFVPFDALILSNGRHLLDDYETSIAPSLAIAGRWWRSKVVAGPVLPSLVLGDPAYSRSGSALSFAARALTPWIDRPDAFPRLPASGREARRVAQLLGNSELALGADASEPRLTQGAARELRVLHIASHAVVDDWSTDRSFIALAPTDEHDGIVSAGELTALGIRANLVVLSACRTARGEVIGGEGVQSLAQPFLERGARAVLATTWAVEDRHAQALVDHFYRALAQGASVATALRDAKLALKASGVSASEWSAYVLLGDASLRIANP